MDLFLRTILLDTFLKELFWKWLETRHLILSLTKSILPPKRLNEGHKHPTWVELQLQQEHPKGHRPSQIKIFCAVRIPKSKFCGNKCSRNAIKTGYFFKTMWGCVQNIKNNDCFTSFALNYQNFAQILGNFAQLH